MSKSKQKSQCGTIVFKINVVCAGKKCKCKDKKHDKKCKKEKCDDDKKVEQVVISGIADDIVQKMK